MVTPDILIVAVLEDMPLEELDMDSVIDTDTVAGMAVETGYLYQVAAGCKAIIFYHIATASP